MSDTGSQWPVLLVESVSGAPGGLWACRCTMPDGRRALVMIPATAPLDKMVEIDLAAAAVLWPSYLPGSVGG